jgi:hypothetical protein
MHHINNTFAKTDLIYIFILALFSFSINWHYSQFGVFPIDSFYHFDTGYRVTTGEFPIKDYWVTTGILVDFMQAFFFNLFGTKWWVQILHSSLFNAFITIITYSFLIKINLDKKYSFFYALMFGILAYTPSATPFVDHHATFFLLIGTYCYVLGIKEKKKLYWFLAPWFFGFSFLCKQVPSSYMIILLGFILIIYSIKIKDIKFLFVTIFSSFLFLIFIFFIIYLLDIGFKNFFLQYILYPPSISEVRFNEFTLTLEDFLNNYKFILLPLCLIIFINYKKNFFNLKNIEHNFPTIIIISLTICLIFHQILTKNQIYIYFLCPLLFAILSNEIFKQRYKHQTYIVIFSLLVSVLVTFKYHERFNENRKFHELTSANMSESINSNLIHSNLSGFKWITKEFKNNAAGEVKILKGYLDILEKDKRNKMVITHYLFYSSILQEQLNSPSRSFTLDGASFPIKDNKYYQDYKSYFNKKIKEKKIDVIYIIDKYVDERVVFDYLNSSCIKNFSLSKNIKIFELKKNCIN